MIKIMVTKKLSHSEIKVTNLRSRVCWARSRMLVSRESTSWRCMGLATAGTWPWSCCPLGNGAGCFCCERSVSADNVRSCLPTSSSIRWFIERTAVWIEFCPSKINLSSVMSGLSNCTNKYIKNHVFSANRPLINAASIKIYILQCATHKFIVFNIFVLFSIWVFFLISAHKLINTTINKLLLLIDLKALFDNCAALFYFILVTKLTLLWPSATFVSIHRIPLRISSDLRVTVVQ